jgi:glutamate--cysteine ligase
MATGRNENWREAAERWRIGTEHEKFVYRTADPRPSYDEPGGIRDLLLALTRIMAGSRSRRAARSSRCRAATARSAWNRRASLELSGAPLENLHQTCAETGRHLNR